MNKSQDGAPTGSARAEWQRGWPIVVGAVFGVWATLIHLHSAGSLLEAIQRDLGWSRAQVSLGVAVASLIVIVANPVVGLVIDRVGARRVALAGMIFYALCLANLSRSGGSFGSWIVGWLLMGTAYATVNAVWIIGVSGYFTVSRGLAIATVLLGTGISGAVAPAAATLLEARFGWRGTYLCLAAFPLVVALPIVFATFRDPRFETSSASGAKPAPDAISGLAVAQIVRSRRFWQMMLASIVIAAPIAGFGVHLIPMLKDQGFSAMQAASLFIPLGFSSMAGRLLGGVLLDRIEAPLVAAGASAMLAIGSLIFLGGAQDTYIVLLAVVLVGLSSGAETDCLGYMVGRYFGMRSIGFSWASILGCVALGSGLGAWLGGALYDRHHDYAAFQVSVIGMLAVAVLLLVTLGRYPRLQPEIRPDPAPDEAPVR